MKSTTILLLAALSVAVTFDSSAANRCVASDGSVSFQDAPCPPGAKESAALRLRENTVGNGVGKVPAPEKLDFGPDPVANFPRAYAAAELLATNGYDCQLDIKIRPGDSETADKCNQFLAQFRTWFTPALDQVSGALKVREWAAVNSREIERALGALKKAKQHHEFVSLYARNQR